MFIGASAYLWEAKPLVMYCDICWSNEDVSVTLERKGLQNLVSMEAKQVDCFTTYKMPVKLLSVDMEDALNAAHCVDCASGMQFCARAPGKPVLSRPQARIRCLRCLAACLI